MTPHHTLALACTMLALCTACSKKAPEPAAPPAPAADAPVVYAAQAPIAVSLELLKEEGQTGRSSPIGNQYRPQVRFGPEATEANCTVQLPDPNGSLAPGQSGPATLVCEAEVRVARAQPGYTMHEGGKLVGRGSVQLP